jgi:hypothetical protein
VVTAIRHYQRDGGHPRGALRRRVRRPSGGVSNRKRPNFLVMVRKRTGSTNAHLHPSRKFLSLPILRGWGKNGACGRFGLGLCGIVDAGFGECSFHALR